MWVGIELSAQRRATSWTVWELNPDKGHIFRNLADGLEIICPLYRISLPGQNGQGLGLTTYPLLEPRLKKYYSYTSTLPVYRYSLSYGNF